MTKSVVFEQLGSPQVLLLQHQDIPQPEADEVQLAVHAAGLNRAELLFFAGQYLFQPVLPSRVGVEASGVVTAIGLDVENVALGDEVSIFPTIDMSRYGIIGEFANVPAWSLVPKPASVSFVDAAAFWMAYGTAWGGLVQAGGLKESSEQCVLVSAASSSVGLAAIDVAKDMGAMVIATTRERKKTQALKACGADHVVVTEEEDLVEQVHSITGGRGFDIAFDPVNGPFVQTLTNAAAKEGMIIEYGNLSGELAPLPFIPMIGKGITLRTFHLGFDLAEHPDRFDQAKACLLPKLESGEFRPKIDRSYELANTRGAYERMASNQQFGKIVIEVMQ